MVRLLVVLIITVTSFMLYQNVEACTQVPTPVSSTSPTPVPTATPEINGNIL